MGSSSSTQEVPGTDRVVICLVGLTGEGKSSTGNTLCGKIEAFSVSRGFSSETQDCSYTDYTFQDHHFRVLDTPGLHDTHLSAHELHRRFQAFADLAPSGVDCFLFVCRAGRFGREKAEAFAAFEDACGRQALNHTVLLFTHLEEQSQEEFVSTLQRADIPPALRSCLQKVEKRALGIDNRSAPVQSRDVVHSEVLRLVAANTGRYCAHAALEEAQKWRASVEVAAAALGTPEHGKVLSRLSDVLNGTCSRADVEDELHVHQNAAAEKSAREAAEKEVARLQAIEKRGFGQREKIYVRIKHILHDYHASRGVSSVAREFIQNADDHGARRFSLVLDARTFTIDGLFHSDMDVMQGPAFVISMDSSCTDADLQRIQELGDSWKQTRFDQVGRFGLGMNTMYAFSDQPILRARTDSADRVCFFDPLQRYAAKGATSPGVRWEAAELCGAHPGQLAALELPQVLPQNTVFRLPLRDHPVHEPLGCNWGLTDLAVQLEDLAAKLPKWMCFLRSVEEIQVALIDEEGALRVAHKFQGPQPSAWRTYQKAWPKDWSEYARLEGAVDTDTCFIKPIVDEATGACCSFTVSSALAAFARETAMEQWASGGFALSPMVSLAFEQTGDPMQIFSGLPICDSPWPAHIDASFDLSSSRTGVMFDSPWNEFLITRAMPVVHRNLLLFMAQRVQSGDIHVENYLRILPKPGTTEPWGAATAQTYAIIVDDPVLPLCGNRGEWGSPLETYWLPSSLARLSSFASASVILSRHFKLVSCLDDLQIGELMKTAGNRVLNARLLGDLFRQLQRSPQSELRSAWSFDDSFQILRFVADAAQWDSVCISDVLAGTRLLCLTHPRRVEVFGNQPFYHSMHAQLLPQGYVHIAAPEIEHLPLFASFPGLAVLTPEDFLRMDLRAAFDPSQILRLKTTGFLVRTADLSCWHRHLAALFSGTVSAVDIQELLRTDWPIALTDDVIAAGRFVPRAVMSRHLAPFYAWKSAPQPPMPPILVWGSGTEIFAAKVSTVTSLVKQVTSHVLPEWGFDAARDIEWAKHLRVSIGTDRVKQLADQLCTMETCRRTSLSAFVWDVWFFWGRTQAMNTGYGTVGLNLLSLLKPEMHRDFLVFAAASATISRIDYVRLLPVPGVIPWKTQKVTPLYTSVMNTAVLPLVHHCECAWGAPRETYWVPPYARNLDSYANACAVLSRNFKLVDCLSDAHIKELVQTAGDRRLTARLLGELFKNDERSHQEGKFFALAVGDAERVSRFLIDMARCEHAPLDVIRRGRRLPIPEWPSRVHPEHNGLVKRQVNSVNPVVPSRESGSCSSCSFLARPLWVGGIFLMFVAVMVALRHGYL